MAHAGAIGGWGLSTTRSRRRVARRPRTVLFPSVETLEGRVVPSTITVTNANNDGGGSLRAAIDRANADPAQDTIDFAASATGTITLLSALPDLATAIILSGPGSSTLTMARSSDPLTREFRIFNVTAGAAVTIAGLTISGGRVFVGDGGGIANFGTLTVTSSTLSGNSAARGGGIANFGTLTVTNSTLSGNSAGLGGGGIANFGTVTITDSTLSGNSAGNGSGGGIDNHSTVTVTNSILGGNSAGFDGGGIANVGKLTVTNSALSGNSAANSGGGGIANFGTATVTDSTLSDNSASFDGGGIRNGSDPLTVTNSTLSGNSTGNGGGGGGGGIVNHSGPVTITNSTLSDNSASFDGGGILNITGTVTVTDSILTGNSASSNGGGMFNNGSLTVTNSTLNGNSAVKKDSGIGNSGTLTVTMSLFANAQGETLSQAPSASFFSGGHNLFSDAPAVALDPTDLINTDPLLGPLANYGGLTQTIPLLPGSPAIDAGRAVPGVTTDKRGVPRTQGDAPDIGAFESRGFSLLMVAGNHQSAPGGSLFASPLVVRLASPFGEPVAGGRVHFSGPTAGPAASFNANPATIDATGLASVLATANGLGGPYVVTAQAAGAAATLAFALENLVFPPTVVGLQRFGVHAQPTTFLLRFSAPLDPVRAQDVANYRIVTLGGHGRGGARIGHVTRVRRAVYDPAIGSVTLHPARRLDLRNAYRLTVRGTAPGGLASPTGVLLDGAGTGQPGSDFVATINRGTLAGSSRAFFNQIRHRWASRMRITGS